MEKLQCLFCTDSIKRAIQFDKNPNSLCNTCKSDVQTVYHLDEEKPPKPRIIAPVTVNNSNPIGLNTLVSLSRLFRYTRMTIENVCENIKILDFRKAKEDFDFREKIKSIYKSSNNKNKLVQSVRRCYRREYDLQKTIDYLKPKGREFIAIADLIQEFYYANINS